MMPAAHKGSSKKVVPRRPVRALSFNGGLTEQALIESGPRIRRPQTLPDLHNGRSLNRSGGFSDLVTKKMQPTKLLFNATIQGSTGAVQLLVSPEATVGDFISMALQQYAKEGRRPVLTFYPGKYGLHYSSFNLESLEEDKKLSTLGSRNFFLYPKKESTTDFVMKEVTTSCGKEVVYGTKIRSSSWIKISDLSKLLLGL